MNNPAISIIIPVYKAQQYLSKCIESIIVQAVTNFEILLIDDGSPDNCGLICDEYASKDSRIHVYHKVNGGVSSARNMGLDNAKGEWITFVDSDDWVESNYLGSIFKRIKDENVDLIVWNVIQRHDNYSLSKPIKKEGYFDKMNDLLECLMYLDMDGLSEGPCNKCYKRNLIRNNELRFNIEMSYLEDFDFNLRYFPLIKSLSVINEGLYNYRHTTVESLSKRAPANYIELSVRLLNGRKELFFPYQGALKEEYSYYLDKKKELLLMPPLSLYLNCTSPDVRRNLWKEYIRIMNSIIIESKFNVTFHDRFRALLLRTRNPIVIDFGYVVLFKIRQIVPFVYNIFRKRYSNVSKH